MSAGAAGLPPLLPGATPVQFQIVFPGTSLNLAPRAGADRQQDQETGRSQFKLASDKLLEAAVALGFYRTYRDLSSSNSPISDSDYFRVATVAFGDLFASGLWLCRLAMENLGSLAEMEHPSQIAMGEFDSAYPHLKDVRDSAAHMDERSRGRGRIKGKQNQVIQPQMQKFGFFTTAGSNVQTYIGADQFGHAALDGTNKWISTRNVEFMKSVAALQRLIDSQTWTGRGHTIPNPEP